MYSENALNTQENTVANRHKVRFYQLKSADGTVVPNAYVVAFEEYVNDTGGAYDNQDIVAILRNVKPAPTGAEIGVENLDGVTYNDRMIFSRIQATTPTPIKQADGTYIQPPNNVVHDRGQLRVRNTGTSDLVVNNVQVTGTFALAAGTATSFTIAPGAYIDLTVVFNAQNGATGIQEGALNIISNDSDEPTVTVKLAGLWQSHSEVTPTGQVTEHPLGDFFKLFGYSTSAVNAGQSLSNHGITAAVGDEVLSGYWQAADPTAPVNVHQLAAYHSQGNTESIKTFLKSNKTSQTTLFTHDGLMGQSVLPTIAGSTLPAQANLSTAVSTSVFGFKIGSNWSDDSLNTPDVVSGQGHYVRFFPAKDSNGVAIPNTWILAMDYYGINYDYQDNIYVITIVRPANPATPAAVTAETSNGGIKVAWTKNTEPTATGYNVYRSDSATGAFYKINSTPVTATQFLDLTAPGGVASYYKVTAADDWGGESAQSAVVSATRAADDAAPTAPGNVTVAGQVDGIRIGWTANSEADLLGYKVYRSATLGGTYTVLNGGNVLTTAGVP